MVPPGIEPATFQFVAHKGSYIAFNKPGQALICIKCVTPSDNFEKKKKKKNIKQHILESVLVEWLVG